MNKYRFTDLFFFLYIFYIFIQLLKNHSNEQITNIFDFYYPDSFVRTRERYSDKYFFI